MIVSNTAPLAAEATRAAEEIESALNIQGRTVRGLALGARAHDIASAAHERAGDETARRHHSNAAALLRDELRILRVVGHVLPEKFTQRAVPTTRSRLSASPLAMSTTEIDYQIDDLERSTGNEERVADLRTERARRTR